MQQSRKGRRSNRRPRGDRAVSGVPKPILAKVAHANFQYNQYIAMTETAAGVGAFYSFRLSDLYDPDLTGTGLQPVGFDQYSVLYSRFRVKQVTVSIELANAANTVITTGAFPSSASTLPASPQSWVCQPYSRARTLCVSTGGNNMCRCLVKYDIPSVLGLTNREYLTDLDFTCTPTSSAIRLAYLHCFVFTLGGVVGIAAGNIRFSYIVEMSQPVLNTLS